MRNRMRKLSTLVILAVLAVAVLPTSVLASPINVSTDKDSYMPGELVTISGNAAAGALVSVEVRDPLASVIYSDVVTANTTGNYVTSFRLPIDAQTGTYTVYASAAEGTDSTTFTVGAAVPDFSLTVLPSTREVAQGGSTSASVVVTAIAGYDQMVSLSAYGVPAGVTVSFSPASSTPTFTSTMTVSVASTVAPGTYTITVKGTGADDKVHTSAFTLTVTSAPSPGAFTVYLNATSGNVGDTVEVSGTCITTGGLIRIYWDSVKDWDGEVGLLAEDYAAGNSYSIDIEIPKAVAGDHYIIVKDVEAAEVGSAIFTVLPEIVLTPDKGLEGDTIIVTGTGFVADAYVTMEYWNGAGYEELTTSPLMPKTDDLGSFICSFEIPTDAVSATDNIRATATVTAYATLNIGIYITITPDEGVVGTTVTVTGRGFTADETVDIRWYMDGSYITLVDDYPIDSNGEFSTTFKVPLVPDPIPPGTEYQILAIDSATPAKTAWETFTVVEPAEIELEPESGEVGDTVTVTGEWFTPNADITITLGATEVATATTDADGSFSVSFTVPEVDEGSYTVKAIDEEDVSATATFKVIVPKIEIKTRGTQYNPGDIISIYGNCTEMQESWLVITDPNDVIFWVGYVDDSEVYWQDMDGWYALSYWPYYVCVLPSDAPLGKWNFTAYDKNPFTHTDAEILDTNLFTVVEKPSLDKVLDRLDKLDAKLSGLFTDVEGNLKAYIETSLGPIITDLDEIEATITKIDGDVATISTKVGEIKTSVDAIHLKVVDIDWETKIATIQSDLGDIKGYVEDVDDGGLATINTDVGTIRTDVSALKSAVDEVKSSVDEVKSDVETVPDAISGAITPIWIAVILSLVAAVAAIASVVTITRKIAG